MVQKVSVRFTDPTRVQDVTIREYFNALIRDMNNVVQSVNTQAQLLEKSFTEFNVVTTTSSLTLSPVNKIVLADATSGILTVTLPPAVEMRNTDFIIKKINTSANDVVITPDDVSETIDGATTLTLTGSTYPSTRILSDGVKWFVL